MKLQSTRHHVMSSTASSKLSLHQPTSGKFVRLPAFRTSRSHVLSATLPIEPCLVWKMARI